MEMESETREGEGAGPERPRVFVTLGDGLAAGFGPWRLSSAGRRTSFPARIARRLGVPFSQPASEPAEILQQVSDGREPALPHHLAVPGLGLDELFERRPTTPLLPADDEHGSAINLVLGLPTLLRPGARPPSLVEAAASHRPTHALICLGYDAAVAAARTGELRHLDGPQQLVAAVGRLQRALGGAQLAVLGIPDPTLSPFLARRPQRRGIRSRVAEQNAALARWARRAEAVYIDPEPALAAGARLCDSRYFGADGLFPNAAGHHRLAVTALHRLEQPWALSGSADSLERCVEPVPEAAPTLATGDRPGLEVLHGAAERETSALAGERELTLELDGGSSFCQIALVEGRGRRRALEKSFGGSLLGLAPLSGVVELRLGREQAGRRRLRLDLPVPLKAGAGGLLRAPELLRVPLDDLELQPVLAFEGRHDVDEALTALTGGVRLRCSFLDALCAAGAPLPEPEVAIELALPPRGSAYHVDLRLRAAWTLSSASVPIPAEPIPAEPIPAEPIPAEPAAEPPEAGAGSAGAGGRAGWRRLEVGASKLLIYLRLTTLADCEQRPSREPKRRPQKPALEGVAGQVDLPTLAVLEGDYQLEAPELGGAARDERRLLGLTRLELGEPVAELQPLIVTLESPSISHGQGGLVGFDGEVRFPQRLWRRRLPTWRQELPSLGVVHRGSGRLLGGLLVAARSNGLPADVSCRLQAQARLGNESGQLRFDLEGTSRVDLPAGTGFHLSGADGELTEPSRVHFRLRLEATGRMAAPRGAISGEQRLLSSNRQLFSFRYALPPKPGERTLFEYRNHSSGGFFQLTCPLRLLFARSPGSRPGRSPDTVILEGLGTWTEPSGAAARELRHVVFVSRQSRTRPYVAILVDGGVTSNVEAGET